MPRARVREKGYQPILTRSRCPLHRKRESQRHASGCKLCVAAGMAAHRRLDRRRDDLSAVGLRKRALLNLWSRPPPVDVHHNRKQHGEKHHFQRQHVDHDSASVAVPDSARCDIKPVFGKERPPAPQCHACHRAARASSRRAPRSLRPKAFSSCLPRISVARGAASTGSGSAFSREIVFTTKIAAANTTESEQKPFSAPRSRSRNANFARECSTALCHQSGGGG
jgi:hypothetical protein